jgi:hypothetical protein
MIGVENIIFIQNGLEVYTKGLLMRGHPELIVYVGKDALVNEGIGFLRYVVGYIIEHD